MCEDSLRVSMEMLLGGPGDPTPQREGKEDQVPALGTTSIREVLQRQASCFRKVSLASAHVHIQTDTPKCTQHLVCHLVNSPSDTLLRHLSTVMARL